MAVGGTITRRVLGILTVSLDTALTLGYLATAATVSADIRRHTAMAVTVSAATMESAAIAPATMAAITEEVIMGAGIMGAGIMGEVTMGEGIMGVGIMAAEATIESP